MSLIGLDAAVYCHLTDRMNCEAKASRIALIGCGAIAEEVIRCLDTRGEISSLIGFMVRPERLLDAKHKSAARFAVVDTSPHCSTCSPISLSRQQVTRRCAALAAASCSGEWTFSSHRWAH